MTTVPAVARIASRTASSPPSMWPSAVRLAWTIRLVSGRMPRTLRSTSAMRSVLSASICATARLPLLAQQAVPEVIRPFVAHVGRLADRALMDEAEVFQQPGRRLVGAQGGRTDATDRVGVEQVVDQQGAGFPGVAFAPLAEIGDGIADLVKGDHPLEQGY